MTVQIGSHSYKLQLVFCSWRAARTEDLRTELNIFLIYGRLPTFLLPFYTFENITVRTNT